MSLHRPSAPHFNRLYISAFILALAVALAVLMALQFAQTQYQRELENWQVRLNLIADSRLGAVDGWLEYQFGEMQNLAENYAVKGYVSRLEGDEALLPAQELYLSNLLAVTAARGEFVPGMTADVVQDSLNGATEGGGGIALLNKKGKVLRSTYDMPSLEGPIAGFIASAEPGQPHLIDMRTSAQTVHIGFLSPVYSIPEEETPAVQTGWVLGLRPLEQEFFGLLRHPGAIEASLEVFLVREENGGVTYLSPLADGTEPLRKHLTIPADVSGRDALAAAFALREPGQFGIHRDYRQKNVLVTGRLVPGTGWAMVVKVDENEALAAAKAERRSLVIQLLLVVAVVFVAIVAAWRHGTSRDATRLASRLDIALRKARSRQEMLEVITNTQPGAIFIVDTAERCRFANDAFAESVSATRDEIPGKSLESLFGPVVTMKYAEASEAALADSKTIIWTRRERDAEGQEKVLRIKHIPLNQLPTEDAPAGAKGVLVLEQDITAVVVERERRARTLRSLVDTLVAMVDRRDPYAANHSKMVATVSREVAKEMQADAVTVETAEIAGTVMNTGKMVVPAEWLTKPGALNEEERRAIRDSLLESADMLENVEFDGPVAGTLRQTLENWDGSGLQGLKGDDILLTARIVAAANAFVGMVSPRSYRKAMGVSEALNVLMSGIDKEFDRKVVVALANYIDNHGGRAMIASLSPPLEELLAPKRGGKRPKKGDS